MLFKKAKIVIDMEYDNSDTDIIDQKRNFCCLYSIFMAGVYFLSPKFMIEEAFVNIQITETVKVTF